MGEESKKDEYFEYHGYGHIAFKCATQLNILRQESQSSHAMKATQSSSKSSQEEKLIAFAAKVEQDAIHSVSRGIYYSDDVLSRCLYFSPRDETGQLSNIDVKGDDIIDELIRVKKCNIKLLKRLNESE